MIHMLWRLSAPNAANRDALFSPRWAPASPSPLEHPRQKQPTLRPPSPCSHSTTTPFLTVKTCSSLCVPRKSILRIQLFAMARLVIRTSSPPSSTAPFFITMAVSRCSVSGGRSRNHPDRRVARSLRGSKSHQQGFYGWRLAYAESEDDEFIGRNLRSGLVDYNGSRRNNLLKIDPPDLMGMHLIVLHEPGDPNPDARFKMLVSTAWTKGQTSVMPQLISRDGFELAPRLARCRSRTTRFARRIFFFPQEHFEQSGLYKWQGLLTMSPASRFHPGSGCPTARLAAG